MTAGQPSAAPGVAQVRLSGQPEDTTALVSVLERLASGQTLSPAGIEILTRSAPYVNRREPGQRVYLTVRVTASSGSGTEAAT
jgi:hypothetical protein